MAPKRLAELIEKLKKGTKKAAVGEGEEGAEETDDEEADEEVEGEEKPDMSDAPVAVVDKTLDEAAAPEGESDSTGTVDVTRIVRERASIWAEKAVKEAKLVPYPRDDTDPVVRERWNRDVTKAAQTLYRLILPGQWYLVRWGGTRKGAGTFYTRPQLAVPTVRRTLQPLCYSPAAERIDAATGLTTVIEWTPRRPEEILALKVCDPAMGSGSFLVSSLRYVTDALVESLHAHGRLAPRADRTIVKLADGMPLEHPSQETLPLPLADPDFDDRLRARLKRHVVERCIYGVDLDALAVELARMALWIETMDRYLPFGFLDHKLRCGNALVGAWFDQFQDYPVMAFERDDAGDKNHDRFVSHFREYTAERGKKKGEVVRAGDVWTHAWKRMKDDVIKPGMREWIETSGPQYRMSPILGEGVTPAVVHDDALAVFRELHDLPVHDTAGRERLYRERIADNPALARLRLAFDTWCAIWFWPGDELPKLPRPDELHEPSPAAQEVVARLRDEHRFFHWELEFPDVFTGAGAGFDAIVGNPPWEIQKPNSKEFFSNIDPLYRTYGKQEALKAQTGYFQQNAAVERDWLAYVARFKSFSTWNKFAAFPFGDPMDGGGTFGFIRSAKENAALHDLWRSQRAGRSGYADAEHPFRHQGSADINTYKMFVEGGRALLKEGGYLGVITPSGIYTDKGSTDLRKLLLDRSRWEWLFGFENRQGIFDIHRSFKFNPIIVRKGGETTAIRTAFMHRAVEDWKDAERHVLAYPRARVSQFSPRSSAILEIRSERDLAVLEKMYRNSVLLGDQGPDGWGIKYATEFHMTNDSKLFPPRTEWERKGYRPNEYGMWIGPDGDVALPLYQGVMINQFDFCAAGYVSGAGNRAVWRPLGWEEKVLQPQFLMARSTYAADRARESLVKVVFRDIARTTDERTFIAAVIPDMPCGNKTPLLGHNWEIIAALDSLAFDWVTRQRLGSTTLNWFIVEELPAPQRALLARPQVLRAIASLALPNQLFSTVWTKLRGTGERSSWKSTWALTLSERLRVRCMIEAVVAHAYGLNVTDLAWVLRDCDHPRSHLGNDEFAQALDAKGFWRTDKRVDPELRHTVLTQVAFQQLQRLGLDAFLNQNDGEGWMIPETLRLADYGLGHDDRAREHQPLASRLGPRFLPWQLEQGVDESWEECARHAERIEALLGVTSDSRSRVSESPPPPYSAGATDLFGKELATNLFGEPVASPKRRKR